MRRREWEVRGGLNERERKVDGMKLREEKVEQCERGSVRE
jgi:hypothetical protein